MVRRLAGIVRLTHTGKLFSGAFVDIAVAFTTMSSCADSSESSSQCGGVPSRSPGISGSGSLTSPIGVSVTRRSIKRSTSLALRWCGR